MGGPTALHQSKFDDSVAASSPDLGTSSTGDQDPSFRFLRIRL